MQTKRAKVVGSSPELTTEIEVVAAPKHDRRQRRSFTTEYRTWTRTLEWHPHIHMLVPAGALAPDGYTWLPATTRRKSFLVPVRMLGQSFRGRLLSAVRRALPQLELPQTLWEKRWVVFVKPAERDP